MNLKSVLHTLAILCFLSLSYPSANAQNSKYEIAPDLYEQLAEKSLMHLADFEFSDFYATLADDVEFYLPDGDEGTRTGIIGKEANMKFWNSYQEKSGNTKITMTNPVYVPVIAKNELNYTKLSGVIVLAYISCEFQYGDEKANVRMNWGFHFNENNEIDRIYTYYDRTPIIEAAKRNFLSQNNK